MEVSETLMRQIDYFDPRELDESRVVIIGAGSIGSCFSLVASKTGFKNIEIIDKDIIEKHNLSNQLFRFSSVGKTKSGETENLIREMSPREDIEVVSEHRMVGEGERFERGDIVILAPDNMETRKLAWESAKMRCKLFVDMRMTIDSFFVYVIDPFSQTDIEFYERNLYSDSEALREPCTARTTMFTVFGTCAIAMNEIIRIFKREDYAVETIFSYKGHQYLKQLKSQVEKRRLSKI